MKLRPYQQEAHDNVINWVRKTTLPCLVEAATGCHAVGHPIMMADGTVKNVEAVDVGNKVMGPDGLPRTVLRLHRGNEDMYEFFPVKGKPFIVNGGHILSLHMTPARRGHFATSDEISVIEYLSKNKTYKHRAKLWRPICLEFNEINLPIDPWVLGVLVGDGHLKGVPSFCSPDKELIDAMNEWAVSVGLRVSTREHGRTAETYSLSDNAANRNVKNRLVVWLESIGLWGSLSENKFIPQIYKTSSIQQRLELIAGLLDTDGHHNRGGYDWISKSRQLADDFVFLCRSVGLAAYMKPCQKFCQTGNGGEYFRVSVSGECSIIPCRITRKKSPARQQVKNHLVTGIRSVSKVQTNGQYYGFELDGDHLYIDGDFIVHHNSGKSHIIAKLAHTVHNASGKRILCLAPSAELVVQNHEKYLATGENASIFSASVGEKSLRHPVVFGTPLTVKNKIERFGKDFAMIVIDEAHGLTPTIKTIVEKVREKNENVRVVGMTATPYRMMDGYIFQTWPDGRPTGEDRASDPYFESMVYRITARDLIEMGFLTQPIVGALNTEAYHTLHLETNRMGQFDASEVDRAFVGQGRKTASIIADVVRQSQGRNGVMIFAATVKHAYECMDSLPSGLSAIVTGETPKADRKRIIAAFKTGKIKYIVNVSVLTTGFDATHVDVVAILRATESVGLLQQIVGRGLRIHDGKADCLILDYAENIERHCPDGDIFAPEIKSRKAGGGSARITCSCPDCGTENDFAARPNDVGYEIDENGYFVDLDKNRIPSDFGDVPAHFGRRCQRREVIGTKVHQCGYRWTFKECPHCLKDNDIAARYCVECKGEIVDPNEKLRADFKALKRDPTRTQTDEVVGWTVNDTVSRAGKEMWRIDVVTPYRSFSFWVSKSPTNNYQLADREKLGSLGGSKPLTITYKKDADSGFYRILGYNREKDEDTSTNSNFWGSEKKRTMPKRDTGAGDLFQQAS